MKPYRHTVKTRKPFKLGNYVMEFIPFLPSKASVKKALSAKLIKLNGREASFFSPVQEGDKLEIERPTRRAPKPVVGHDIKAPVVYEDDHVVIVNKPGGIAVNGNRHKTVENIVQHEVARSPEEDALAYPMPVHRLDVPTSGLVVMARTRVFQIGIGKALQNKEVNKRYIAVLHGKLEGTGVVDKPLEGKECESRYRSLRIVPSVNFGHLTMVELEPVTGRTHQLRKHMQMIGHPIAGDKEYNDKDYNLQGKGMLLCAVAIAFIHPVTGEKLAVSIEPPGKFERVLDREARFFDKKKD